MTSKKEKGQMLPFRMLIAVIMGLMILMIILSAIDYFSGFRMDVSQQRLKKGFASALQNISLNEPESKNNLTKVESLVLPKGTYTAATFAQNNAIGEECISFEAPSGNSSYDVIAGGKAVKLKTDISTNVFFACWASSCGDFGVECTAFFGFQPS